MCAMKQARVWVTQRIFQRSSPLFKKTTRWKLHFPFECFTSRLYFPVTLAVVGFPMVG